jgi:tetratricopeptide (TPR) repeat protein
MPAIMKLLLLVSMLAALIPVTAMADFATLVAQGDAHDRKSETEQALTFYLPAEKLTPDDPELLVKIARQYVQRMGGLTTDAEKIKSGRTALRYAERAVALAPDQCDPHLSVAICWGKLTPLLGNKEKVAASRQIRISADRAVKLDPKNDYGWHVLGRWHQAMANMGPATRAFAKLIYGALPAASNEESVACLKKAIKLNPKRLVHTIELGRTYAMMGDTAQAKKYIQQGLAMPNREKDDAETKQRGRKTLEEI